MLKTLKLYVRPDKEAEQGFVYYVDDADYSNHWPKDIDIHIGDVEVFFNPPAELDENELRLKAITTLKDKQEKIRAQAHKEVERLQKRIDQMMLLTHQPDPHIIEGDPELVQ